MARTNLASDNVYESAYGPTGLARRLATYIRNPSTVRARVMDHYGSAPSLAACQRIIDEVNRVPRTHYSRKVEGYAYEHFDCEHDRIPANVHIEESGEAYCARCREMVPVAPEKPAPIPVKLETPPVRLFPAWYVPPSRVRPRLTGETLKAVAGYFRISVEDLTGDDRARYLVDARAVAVQIFRMSGMSFPRISKVLNRKCHSTSMNLHDTWRHRVKREPRLLDAVERLRH